MGIFSRRRDDRDDLPPPATQSYGANDHYAPNAQHHYPPPGANDNYTHNPDGNYMPPSSDPRHGTHHGVNGMHGATNNHYPHNSNEPYNAATTNDHYPHNSNEPYNTATTNGHHNHNAHHNVNDVRGTHDSRYSPSDEGRHHRGGLLKRRQHKERTHKERTSRPLFDLETGNFNRRPSFGQWLKFTWLDILTMAASGAIGLGVYNADPAPSRSFPITFSNGQVVYPEVAYPLRNEIIPIWAAALMASLIPIFIILCMQIRIRSFWDVNNAIIGLLYSLITAAMFQVFIKWLIGGLRPHFLTVCDPDPAIAGAAEGSGNGFQGIMFDRSICRGDRSSVNDALESMPSGHSTAGFAGFIFLYYYLNAKLKVWSNYHPAMWKLIATYAPVLGATLIAGAMTIDEYHHWYDVLAGAIIGTVMATSAYRMVYASIWDFRFNHIPLTRHTPFSFGAGAAGAGGFESTVFTRRAGWGYEEAFGGAPFDAAYHLRDQVAGFNTSIHTAGHHNKEAGSTAHGLGHGHGHGNRHDDIERNAAAPGGEPGMVNGTGHHGATQGIRDQHHHHDGPGMTNNTNVGDAGYVEGDGETNRYRQHRKSIERKAVRT